MAILNMQNGQFNTDTGVVTPNNGDQNFNAYTPPSSELLSTVQRQNNNGIVSGTDQNRDTRTSDINSLLNDLKIKASNVSAGMTTSDQAEIDSAVEAARQATQELVDSAIETRTHTLPTEVVRAGQRGGFENSQYSGIAALQGTNPNSGESFVGIGGKLDQTRQNLDKAVIAARAAQQKAMIEAKIAAQQAIRTRRKDDYDVAKGLYDASVQAQQYADGVEQQKKTFDENVRQFNLGYDLSLKQDKRAEIESQLKKDELTYSIIKEIPDGETQVINGTTYTGIKKPEPFWTAATITSLMENIPEGTTKTIVDPVTKESMVITGIKPVEPNTQVFKSVNENTGNETFTTIDTKTGKIVNQIVSKGTGARFKGGSGGGSNTKMTPEEQAFQKDLSDAIEQVTKDKNNWGQAWNYMYSRYRNDLEASAKANNMTVADVLDHLMNKQMNFPEAPKQEDSFLSKSMNWASSLIPK